MAKVSRLGESLNIKKKLHESSKKSKFLELIVLNVLEHSHFFLPERYQIVGLKKSDSIKLLNQRCSSDKTTMDRFAFLETSTLVALSKKRGLGLSIQQSSWLYIGL